MIAVAILVAQYTGTLDLGATTELGLRSSQPPVITPSGTGKVIIAADLSASASARLHLSARPWDFTLSYSPSFTAADVEQGLNFEALGLESGGAALSWRNNFWAVTVSESLSYGQVNSALLYATAGATGGATPAQAGQPSSGAPASGTGAPASGTGAPASGTGTTASGTGTTASGTGTSAATAHAQTINIGSSSTALGVGGRLGSRSTLSLSTGYSVGGGLTAADQALLPRQQSVSGGAGFTYRLSREDNLNTAAGASDTLTLGACPTGVAPPKGQQFCQEQTPTLQAQESIGHQLSHTATLTVGAGAGASILQTPLVEEWVITPVGSVTFADRLGARGMNTLTLSALFTPVVDIRTGLPSTRIQTTASLGSPLSQTATISGTVSWLQSVPFPVQDPYPITTLSGGIGVQFLLTRQIGAGVGLQELWQQQTGYPSLASTVGYISLGAHAPTLRL